MATEEACREVEVCCTDIYEEMRAAGIPVPYEQCDFSYLVEEHWQPNMPPCQELWTHYNDFAHSLFMSGAIHQLPPSCTYYDPFTIEPGEEPVMDFSEEPVAEEGDVMDFSEEPAAEEDVMDFSEEPAPEEGDVMDFSEEPLLEEGDVMDFSEEPAPEEDVMDFSEEPGMGEEDVMDFSDEPVAEEGDVMDFSGDSGSDGE